MFSCNELACIVSVQSQICTAITFSAMIPRCRLLLLACEQPFKQNP